MQESILSVTIHWYENEQGQLAGPYVVHYILHTSMKVLMKSLVATRRISGELESSNMALSDWVFIYYSILVVPTP